MTTLNGTRSLSHSSVETYQQCPRKYQLVKLERVPQAPAPALILGIAVHTVIEHLGRYVLDGVDLSADALTNAAVEIWRHEALVGALLEKDPQGLLTDEEVDDLHDRSRAIVRTFVEEVLPHYHPVAIEEDFSGPIPGLPGWTFSGRRDARTEALQPDGTVVPTTIDFKTANKFWPIGAEHSKLQAAAYGFGDSLSGRNVADRFTFVIFVASPGCSTATLDVRPTRRSINQVASYISNLQEVAAGITRGDFPARPSPLCGWCGVCHACPEGLQWLRERGREPQPEIQRFMAQSEGGQQS